MSNVALLQQISVDVGWLDYAIVAVYLAFTVGIGIALRSKIKSSEDYFLSGRALPSWVTGLAFIGVNLGALEVMGMAAGTAQYGIMMAHHYWIGAAPALVFLAIFMMPFYYGSRVHSLPGYLKLRYNEATRGFSAVAFGVVTLLFSGINMYAMALVFRLLLGWSISTSMVLSAGIVLVYIVLGGLSSSIYNEVLQFFLLVLGLLPLTLLGLRDVGGWSGLQERIRDPGYFHLWAGSAVGDPTNQMAVSWLGVVLGLGFVLAFGYWCTDFLVIQRALAAEDEAAAQRTPLIAAFPKLLFPLITIVPGFIALTSFPELGQGTSIENSYNMALPYTMAQYLPSGLLGLGLTALLASFMSGMAGNVTAFNTVWTYDIYRSYIRGDAPDRHYLNMGRIVTVVGIAVSVGTAYVAMSFESLFDYVQLLFSFFTAPLLGTMLLGMFWSRTTGWGGFVGLAGGTTAALLLYLSEVMGFIEYGSVMGSNFWRAWWAWLACFALTVVVSLFTRPKPREELKGLVWGLTETKRGVEPTWYKRPAVLAGTALVATLAINVYLF